MKDMVRNEPRMYACTGCGNPYPAYTPDDVHTIARLEACIECPSIEVPYVCEKCNKKNSIQWDMPHDAIG